MSDDHKLKASLAQYDATTRRQDLNWRTRFDHMLHSDRAAVDIGIGALKTIITLNAGALVALLAFFGQIWSNNTEHKFALKVLVAGQPFIWGLIFGGTSFLVAYFYQSVITCKFYCDMELELLTDSIKHQVIKQKKCRVSRAVTPLALFMVLLAVLAFVFFIFGVKQIFLMMAES